jgi:hypothetical protein
MQGIELTAKIFEQMQLTRGLLIKLGESHGLSTPAGKQDLRLAQLLNIGKDAMKDEFCQITIDPQKFRSRRRHHR